MTDIPTPAPAHRVDIDGHTASLVRPCDATRWTWQLTIIDPDGATSRWRDTTAQGVLEAPASSATIESIRRRLWQDMCAESDARMNEGNE